MKELKTWIGLLAICATSALFTGCGNDDDNGGSTTTANNAPASLQGQTYDLAGAQTTTIAFSTEGNNYTLIKPDSSTESGTFTAVKSGENWEVTATDTAGQVSHVTLNFASASAGSFSYTPANSSTAQQGQFLKNTSSVQNPPPVDPGSTNTPPVVDPGSTNTPPVVDPGSTNTPPVVDPGTTNTPPATTTAPASIASITIHADASSVSGVSDYTATLTGTASGTFTAGADLFGTFTYQASGTTAHLRLNYQGQFQGDFDDMTLDFSSNTLNGTQRYNSQDGGIHGTFSNVQ